MSSEEAALVIRGGSGFGHSHQRQQLHFLEDAALVVGGVGYGCRSANFV